MPKTTLVLADEVNCRFLDLEPSTRRKIVEALSFTPGYARHTPAFKMGRWDGKISFATVGAGTYINLLDKVLPIVIEDGYEIEVRDERLEFPVLFEPIEDDFLEEYVWPAKHRLAGEPIILAEHQVRAANNFLANTQSIMEIATGAGKTIITAALAKKVEQAIPGGRTLTIVPSKSLVVNTEDDFRLVGLDVGVFFGDRKEWGHQHIVATWQSLSVFAKKNKRKQIEVDRALQDLLQGVVAVIVDETHSAKAVELKALLSDPYGCANVPIRWGMTGTIPDEKYEEYAILGVVGPIMEEKITAKELQDNEVLSQCHIHIQQTDEAHLVFEDYAQANKFLVSDPDRMAWLAEFCQDLSKTGNVLILHANIVTADMLKKNIPDLKVVDGSLKLSKRTDEYDSIKDDTQVILAATYGVAAVGINIPAIHHLVLVEAGKAIVRVIQSVGRGLRRTNEKLHVDIHDVCSTNKFSKRHLAERKKRYKNAEYPFTTNKITY